MIKSLEINERVLREAKFFLEKNTTVRGVAKITGMSKSTIHKDLKIVLPEVDSGLAKEVEKLLEKNKQERHIRGGEATKKKYLML